MDEAVTDYFIERLSSMEVEGKLLTVRRAFEGHHHVNLNVNSNSNIISKKTTDQILTSLMNMNYPVVTTNNTATTFHAKAPLLQQQTPTQTVATHSGMTITPQLAAAVIQGNHHRPNSLSFQPSSDTTNSFHNQLPQQHIYSNLNYLSNMAPFPAVASGYGTATTTPTPSLTSVNNNLTTPDVLNGMKKTIDDGKMYLISKNGQLNGSGTTLW